LRWPVYGESLRCAATRAYTSVEDIDQLRLELTNGAAVASLKGSGAKLLLI